MKRRFSILAIAAIVFFAGSCAELDKELKRMYPTVNLKGVELIGLDLGSADMRFKYEVQNNAAFPIDLNKVVYKINADGKEIFSGTNNTKIAVAAKGKGTFQMDQKVEFVSLGKSLIEAYQNKEVKIDLAGKVGFFLKEINHTLELPISASQVLSVPQLPKVNFKGVKNYRVDIRNPLDPKMLFDVNFGVTNENTFLLDIPNLSVNFSAENRKLLSGEKQNLKLASGQEQVVSMPVTVRGVESYNALSKVLQGGNFNYSLNGDIDLNLTGKTFKLPYSLP